LAPEPKDIKGRALKLWRTSNWGVDRDIYKFTGTNWGFGNSKGFVFYTSHPPLKAYDAALACHKFGVIGVYHYFGRKQYGRYVPHSKTHLLSTYKTDKEMMESYRSACEGIAEISDAMARADLVRQLIEQQ
jgi:hypothetical protein